MSRTGRPTDEESERRQSVMVGLLASGVPWDEAAELARVKPATVLGLLSRRADFRSFAIVVLADPIAA